MGDPQVQPQVQAQVLPPAVPRSAMNRQFAPRRSFPGVPHQSRPMSSSSVPMLNKHDATAFSASSPQGQPTPSSHASSPNALSVRSPGSGTQSMMTPPSSTIMTSGQAQHFNRPAQPQPPRRSHYMMQNPQQRSAQMQYGGPTAGETPRTGGMMHGQGAAAYPSPFQKHGDGLGKSPHPFDQIELCRPRVDIFADQECDTTTTATTTPNQMIDVDQVSNDSRHYQGAEMQPQDYHEHYPQQYHHPSEMPGQTQGGIQPDPKARPRDRAPPQFEQNGHHQQQQMNIDNFDPMFDADPFGLTASMHFPTTYSFDQQPPAR